MNNNISHNISPIEHLQKHEQLLRMEYEYEKETFKQQTLSTGILKKIGSGICWYPLSVGKSYYNSLNQLVIEIERKEDKGNEHQFEFGKPVCFFTQTADGSINYFKFTATVNYTDEDLMVVIIPDNDAAISLQNAPNPGVQLYFDETSYRLMFDALSSVINAKQGRLAELRNKFYGREKLNEFTFHPIRFPWLNSSQEEAVNKVLHAKDVAIVHGPPGTGKTTTLVEAIYETLNRENQVLVCAQSNMAVDWISEKLVDRGVSVLRIGNPSRVNDKMLSFTYEKRFEAHPDYPQLWGIRKAIRELYSKIKQRSSEREKLRIKINSLKDRVTELEIRINNDIFAQARVIASTLTGSANKVLNGQKFGTLFIDEAAQSLEAACWIAIEKADRVILAGDHCQLPPTIKCYEASKKGLDITMMQKITTNKPEAVSLLKTQYRMNEEIMHFSSQWFYNGMLQAAKEVKYRGILDFDSPIEWIDTSDDDYKESVVGNNSKINKEEAELTIAALINYLEKIGKDRVLEEKIDIGIISPYKAQVHYLRHLIKKNTFFKPFKKLITVNTVDGFQGQERDVIFITLVRSNDNGEIGFLGELRRMNVAMTRARMKLIILGNRSTMSHHKFYRKLMEYIDSLNE